MEKPEMPNIAAVLKDEIRRLARREVKPHAAAARRAAANYRRDMARLKQLLGQQEQQIKCLKKELQQQAAPAAVDEGPSGGVRYSARSVKARRQRLGLSAQDYGRLVGVAPLTIYNWEHGKSRPRPAQLAALVAIRGMGKREALKKLADLQQQPKKKR
jgi:DNA-binding transcriptional regulator YiaG